MCKSLFLLRFLGRVDKPSLFYYNYSMSKEIDNKNKREVDMSKYHKTREAVTKMVGEQFDKNINEHIWVNGIQGIDSILTMIIDRIEDNDTDGAVDDIRQLQDELLNNNVRS